MKTSKKLLFSLIPLSLLLFSAEATTRIVGAPQCQAIEPQPGNWKTMIGDRDLLWRLEANATVSMGDDVSRINAVGLREKLLPSQPKKSGEKRIIVTGDSSIYGWGVRDHETYAVLLEQELRRRLQINVEVINLGVPGYSTEQTIRLLEQVGWQYEPDLVIISNLFSDCNIDAFQDRQALQLTNPKPNALQKVLQNSRAYCAGYMYWASYQSRLNQDTNRVLMPGIPTGANAAVRLEKINSTLALSRVPIPQYLDNLSRIQQTAKQHHAKVMLAPLAQEWDVGIWNVPMPKPGPDHVLPWFPYRQAQKEWASKSGVSIVDFAAVFARYKGDPKRLFIDNMHPSKEGNMVMARAIADHLSRNQAMLGLAQKHRHHAHDRIKTKQLKSTGD